MTEKTVALWYDRYGQRCYSLYRTEDEAVRGAIGLEDWEEGWPVGIQFSDGRTLAREGWPAYWEARGRENQRAQDAVRQLLRQEPRPTRKILDPFDDQTVVVDADEPAWLGTNR